MNILFTCACGKKSEQLFKIIRKNFKEKINLYGCDIKKKTKKTYLNNFFQIDFENKKKFIKQIFDVCKEYKIDFLFASADREIDIFAKNIKKFNRIKTKILVNNQNYSKIFNDKFKTYEALKKIKVDVPKYKLVKKISNVDKILKDFDYQSALIALADELNKELSEASMQFGAIRLRKSGENDVWQQSSVLGFYKPYY